MSDESWRDSPVFGTVVPGCPYVVRPSAYALVRNAPGEFAIIHTPQGFHLPGGGIEPGETPAQTVEREAKEEAGLILHPRFPIGKAIEIVYSADESTCFEKRCVFIEAELIRQEPSHEQDHQLTWLDYSRAVAALSPESHGWALQHYAPTHAPHFCEDSSTRSWNEIADDWVAHADTNDYRIHYLMPRMLEMLGQVAGKTILDVGCGEGGYARELARRGASVTGIDGSERLIEIARQRSGPATDNPKFLHANASSLAGIASASFDLVVAAMSLMDVEDYLGAIRDISRVLRPGGELAMSITHPCFSAPVSEWIRDPGGGLQFFAVDRYFERSAWGSLITPAFRAPVLRRHRPLEDYMRAPVEHGFQLAEFREPGVTPEELQHSHRFRKLERIPYFLFMRWRKP